MININPVRVAVNGYGVIGKRVATAVLAQKDMRLAGVADIATDWRLRVLEGQGIDLYAVTSEHAKAMREAGIPIAGTLDDLLGQADVVVDCTPKRVAAQNAETYRASGLKFIVHGGEKHAVTGPSSVAEVSFNGAWGRAATRVGSCNTTPTVRTLQQPKRVGEVYKVE